MKTLILILLLSVSIFSQANGTVSGRLINTSGNGVGSVTITSFSGNCQQWQSSSTLTNPFGYYTVGFRTNCDFAVTPDSKIYSSFNPESYVFIQTGQPFPPVIENIDFTVLF